MTLAKKIGLATLGGSYTSSTPITGLVRRNVSIGITNAGSYRKLDVFVV